MDPSTIPKESFRASLTRILKRTANAQKAVRQQQMELRSDLNSCAQPMGLLQSTSSAVLHVDLPPLEQEQPQPFSFPKAKAQPQEHLPRERQPAAFQPAIDDAFFILVHVTDLYLAQGLRALSPNQCLSNLRIYIKSPPNTEEELTMQKSTYLVEHTKLKTLEISLVAELETATGTLDFQLGAAYIDVNREINSLLYRLNDSGAKIRQFSRRRVNILFSEMVPINSVIISSNYSGRTDAIQGNLLIGAVGVSILCGGQPLLEYEQSLRAKPCMYLNVTKYIAPTKKISKSTACMLETPTDVALYCDIILGRKKPPVPVEKNNKLDIKSNAQPGVMHKVAAICCIAKTSRVFIKDPGPIEKIYAVATLQPSPELAAIIGYRLTQMHKLSKDLKEPGTSTAVRTITHNKDGQNLVYADTSLTISRKISLIPSNINYLLHGSLSLSVFGFSATNPRKIFLGSVEVPLAECYSSGITIGGWFALNNSPYTGYIYTEVSIGRSVDQDNESWNSAEAPEPPTFAPPAFSTQTASAPLIPQMISNAIPAYQETLSELQRPPAPKPVKDNPVPLLKPDSGVYEEIGNIVSELNGLFVNF